MCGIIGSFNPTKVLELIDLNSYRGNHSYSFSVIDPETSRLFIVRKGFGAPNKDLIERLMKDNANRYYLMHIQAPTTEQKDTSAIHPAEVTEPADMDGATQNTYYLWHNGIIKDKEIERLQKKYDCDVVWDTQLLAYEMVKEHTPQDVDGTFSCVFAKDVGGNHQVCIFRNEISPLFMDENFTISSTKFENSRPTQPNVIWCVDFNLKKLYNVGQFATKENPYFFG